MAADLNFSEKNICPLCSGNDTETFLPLSSIDRPESFHKTILVDKLDCHAAICKICGFIYLFPSPPINFLSMIVKSFYQDNLDFLENAILNPLFSERLNVIKNLFAHDKKKHYRILDIGCSSGYLLKMIGKHLERNSITFELFGIDPDLKAVSYGRENYGLDNLYCAVFEECGFPSSFFDIILSIDTFNCHFYPIKVLDEINRILKPDGFFYLETSILIPYNNSYTWPGFVLNFTGFFPSFLPFAGWYTEEHIIHMLNRHIGNITKKGTITFNPCNYPLPYYFYIAQKSERKSSSASLSCPEKAASISDYLFNYCENITDSELRKLISLIIPTSIGCCGGEEENQYIAGFLKNIDPEIKILFSSTENQNIIWSDQKGNITSTKGISAILITLPLENPEELIKNLSAYSKNIFHGFHYEKYNNLFYYNKSLKQKKLLKSFVAKGERGNFL